MALVLAERYVVGRALVEGGQARIVEGFDRSLSRRVAIKLLPEGTDDDAQTRFMREAYAGAGLVHPNIVSVYDAGEDGGIPYIVMELVDGENLATHLTRRGPLPVREAMQIAGDVLAGLGAIHDRGLVHRDVKPGNILLPHAAPAKLADFGIVKRAAADPDLTQAGIVLGTPRYLAPEQASGAAATPRSDVYAMGVTMYEMLVGAPPFEATDPLALALAHRSDPVPPIEGRRPGVPGYLVAVIEQALAKHPAGRFRNANAMLAALRGTDPDTTQALERHRTAGLPAVPPAVRKRRLRRLFVVLLAGFLAVGLAATALALVVANAGDAGPQVKAVQPGPTTTATTLPVQETAASTTTLPSTTTTTAPVETTTTAAPVALPADIEELAAIVDANPDAYGTASEELVALLNDVAEERGRRAREAAADAIDAVRHWVEVGALDPVLGDAVVDALLPIADPPSNGDD